MDGAGGGERSGRGSTNTALLHSGGAGAHLLQEDNLAEGPLSVGGVLERVFGRFWIEKTKKKRVDKREKKDVLHIQFFK